MDVDSIEKDKEHGKLYQDQLYGTKVLTPLAVAVIDTPEFQRLAGLKQLGFADLAYRSAQHTRFTHSIGTYLMTRTIMRRIAQNHERLELNHPGEGLPECFRIYPHNAFSKMRKEITTSYQSLWRGLMEVVSIAALLHDIGHVPFGHTLEDEFSGIYERHDTLGGPRLYEMLFNEESELRKVFSDTIDTWIHDPSEKGGIPNETLAQLIFVILSWKEKVDPPKDFESLLNEKLKEFDNSGSKLPENKDKKRVEDLRDWYNSFKNNGMFHPFMSDIIGNTICADLLDYLPRDRMNLGMEYREHGRLQRYLTIRKGTLYPGEGLRVSIMVTRSGRGGQRRDVATAVLDIMRERYEMAERVYYHHKKAAASSMLAKLVELSPKDKPSDDANIYPAPWNNDIYAGLKPSNICHFSDSTFIEHVRDAEVERQYKKLKLNLYSGLRYDRRKIYRTLLVIDTDLIHLSSRPISYFAKDLREHKGKPSNLGRQVLENELAESAGVPAGNVLIYCPSPDMQSKEVDARLEIIEGRVLPLRVQRESFAYQADVRVLEQYYQELWRMYIFVSPEIYDDPAACQKIVDTFCERYEIVKLVAYNKVRRYNFKLLNHEVVARNVLEPLRAFIDHTHKEGSPFRNIPTSIVAGLLAYAESDNEFLMGIRSGSDTFPRISIMFDIVILEAEKKKLEKKAPQVKHIETLIKSLKNGNVSSRLIAAIDKRGTASEYSFEDYSSDLVEFATKYKEV
jgi:hypothetical protein